MWIQSFMDYAVDISKLYREHPENILNCLGFVSVHGSLNETYQMLVREKQILPIEEIDEHEKQILWTTSLKYSEKKQVRVLICRSIYLLNELTK